MSNENNNSDGKEPVQGGRRTFCKACIGGLTAVSAGLVAAPVVSFLGRPQSLSLNKPLEVGLDTLAPGQAVYKDHQGQQLIVLVGDGGPQVFSASCPHLGCSVTWEASEAVFRCPCHGAIFSSAGEVVSGPVSAALKKIPFEIKDRKVIIS